MDIGQKVVHINIKDSDGLDIASLISAVENTESAIFFVDGLRWAGQKDGSNIYRVLNTSREYFVTHHICVVFWLTENEAINLARYAPDYWAYRHRVVEFIESPEPEQILLRSLSSTWQILGEDTDTIENTDEKIALRRAMLDELPNSTEAMAIRSNLQLSLGILHWRKGAMDNAMEYLNNALEIATRISEPRLQAACFNAIAIVQTDMGLVDDAISSYRTAINLTPDQIFTWNNLGNLYEKLNRCDEAIDAFTKALERNPTDALAWNGFGNVYLRLYRHADAVSAYNKSIECLPSLAYPWNGLGNAYASKGDFDAAIPAYQKSVELNKDFSIPWVNLGDIYQEQGHSKEALKAYWNAVRIDSKNAQIWNSLGNAYMSAGLSDEAIQAYNKAIKLNRNYEAAYTNLAVAYSLAGRYEESVAFYQKSVELLSNQKSSPTRNQIEQTYQQFVLSEQEEPESTEVDEEVVEIEDPVDVQIREMLQEFEPTDESETDDECELGEVDELDDEEFEDLSDLEEVTEFEQEFQDKQPTLELIGLVAAELQSAPVFEQAAAVEEELIDEKLIETQPMKRFAGLEEFEFGNFEFHTMTTVSADVPETATDESEAQVEATMLAFGIETAETVEATASLSDSPIEPVAIETESDLPIRFFDIPEGFEAIPAMLQETELPFVIEEFISEADQPGAELVDALASDTAPVMEASSNSPEPVIELCFENEETAYVTIQSKIEPAAPVQEQVLETEKPAASTIKPRIERMPKDAHVWNELGNIYFNISEYEEAAAAYKQAIELDTFLGWGYSNLALTYALQDRFEEAAQVYGKLIELLSSSDGERISWQGSGSTPRVNYNRTSSLRHVADALSARIEPKDDTKREVSIDAIYANPNQAHVETDLDELVDSVRKNGILEPLVVTPNGKPGKFMLVSGMRRLQAARRLGMKSVPVVVRETSEREKIEIALIENAQRPDINPLELAEAFFRLTEEFHLSSAEIAARVGKNQLEISNSLSLLKLSEKVKLALAEQLITEDHARALLALSTPLAQNILLKNILSKKLTVRQTEELVHNSVGRKPSFLFAETEYDDEELWDEKEPIQVAYNAPRKEVKQSDFSLISRARSILKSNR
ncbi:MAG: tetratricopeptide repeat protein, partial [Chloroflexi bacterium]|nr:tetratricopeptide repeat protein [Chloroflexota bacterium]